MELIEYERLYNREKFYWWNIGRRKILRSVLENEAVELFVGRSSILDLGCGAGGNILFVKDIGEVTGLDISKEALKFSEGKGFKSLVLGDAISLQSGNAEFDLVMSLDVLEHIKDDKGAIGEIYRVLRLGGFALITVPAHPWLWSVHDEAMHHIRRYSATDIRGKLLSAGFQIIKESHFVVPAIPFLLAAKIKRKIHIFLGGNPLVDTLDIIHPPLINNALIGWLGVERFVMQKLSIPFGSSHLLLCKKV